MTTTVDGLLGEAYFLHRHPGWSPRDMDDANQELIESMSMIYNAEAATRSRRSDPAAAPRPVRRRR